MELENNLKEIESNLKEQVPDRSLIQKSLYKLKEFFSTLPKEVISQVTSQIISTLILKGLDLLQ